jgi:hypothetical protein
MPLRYKRRLLEHLKHRNYTPSTLQTLTADLGIEDEVDFADAVQLLAGEGVVEISEKGLVELPSLASLKGPVEGRF